MYFKLTYLNLKRIVFLVLALLAVQSGYSKTNFPGESKVKNKIEKALRIKSGALFLLHLNIRQSFPQG